MSIPARKRWYSIRARSKIWEVEYLTLAEFEDFFDKEKVCFYCLITEEISIKLFGRVIEIDRKDPQKPYLKDNIVFACKKCNSVKSDVLGYEEMLEIGRRFIMPKWKCLLIERK